MVITQLGPDSIFLIYSLDLTRYGMKAEYKVRVDYSVALLLVNSWQLSKETEASCFHGNKPQGQRGIWKVSQ